MLPILLLAAAAATATCPEPSFEFVGQPECVQVVYEGGTTDLTNSCSQTVLVDQSVVLPDAGSSMGLIAPHTAAELRDLSAFTLGLGGRLYRVVATVVDAGSCPEEPLDTAEDTAIAPSR